MVATILVLRMPDLRLAGGGVDSLPSTFVRP